VCVFVATQESNLMVRRRNKMGKINQIELETYRIRQEFMEAQLTEDSDSDDELPLLARATIPDSELPPRYWFILKVIKYIRVSIEAIFFPQKCGLGLRC